jgi:hypothetical protein
MSTFAPDTWLSQIKLLDLTVTPDDKRAELVADVKVFQRVFTLFG